MFTCISHLQSGNIPVVSDCLEGALRIVVGDEQLLIHSPGVVPLGQIVDALDLLDVDPRHTVQRPDGVTVVVGQ